MRPRTIKQYEVLRKLGAGGRGVVYYATDTKLMRPVVLKMLQSEAGSTLDTAGAILREARLASAIEHPNVCAIYEVDEFEGQPFIAMQYVPGQTLKKLIETGPLSFPLQLSIGIQISDGLAAAHHLGILHRDLKPANIMITEGGLVKIVDFGLAVRVAEHIPPGVDISGDDELLSSLPLGTVAYMAPEQFVTGRSTEQSDIFALGIIMYEMATGSHPFLQPEAVQPQVARAIQYLDPVHPREKRSEIPVELERLVLQCLEKQPANRIHSAVEIREALKTLVKTLHYDFALPGESLLLPTQDAEPEKKAGIFSMLAERFMGHGAEGLPNSILVFPFKNMGAEEVPPFYGYALAEAISGRLARIPVLLVRPTSSLVTAENLPSDPVAAGRKLSVANVLTGSFLRSRGRFVLNWQLVDVASSAVRSGASISVESLDLVAIQKEIADEIYAALQGSGHLQAVAPGERSRSAEDVSEDYLQARALLSNFSFRTSLKDDLDKARNKFRAVLARDPNYAPAQSGLGIANLLYVQRGLGGMTHLIEAQKCFERALAIDPDFIEAKLFQVHGFLWRGEKESARQGLHHLLKVAEKNYAVHLVAATIFRLDGLYADATSEASKALSLNPASATVVYNERARIYHYQGQLDLASEEVTKGLTLEPKHPLLRTTLGYLYFRQSEFEKAISTLESLLEENPDLKIAYPTLAMFYLKTGDKSRAASLVTDDILAVSEADSEMAYRVATCFALDANATEALHWLRKTIYLGNENYPWFSTNPAWEKVRSNPDIRKILSDLRKAFRLNTRRWKQLK